MAELNKDKRMLEIAAKLKEFLEDNQVFIWTDRDRFFLGDQLDPTFGYTPTSHDIPEDVWNPDD